ncbi:hypothetical protein CAXC1_150051 [Candidatus Xenohaliotis californiensis]|uniref:Uncharacterized protein n=1 Tax=Candidatus Xenohaliotis californiensis TaxID=84677 RepID=A0ABP0EV69_9RICK|nr:hypothetical protein CAXC1_150051 [Candidatus Xenohaliotis californiensis]
MPSIEKRTKPLINVVYEQILKNKKILDFSKKSTNPNLTKEAYFTIVLHSAIQDLFAMQKTEDDIRGGVLEAIGNALQNKPLVGGHNIKMNKSYEEVSSFIRSSLSNTGAQISKDNITSIVHSMLSIASSQQRSAQHQHHKTQLFSTLGRSTKNILEILTTKNNAANKLASDLMRDVALKTKHGTYKTSLMDLMVRDYAIATQQHQENRSYKDFKAYVMNSLAPNEAISRSRSTGIKDQPGIGIVASALQPTNHAFSEQPVQQYEALLLVFSATDENPELKKAYDKKIDTITTKGFSINTPSIQYSSSASQRRYEQKLKKPSHTAVSNQQPPKKLWTKSIKQGNKELGKG